ncbi:hypothetical protein EAE99_009157 [Botrytis elliptica]|nr:hypothetical protein EAE99_009157 [Botrytis elliptica]
MKDIIAITKIFWGEDNLLVAKIEAENYKLRILQAEEKFRNINTSQINKANREISALKHRIRQLEKTKVREVKDLRSQIRIIRKACKCGTGVTKIQPKPSQSSEASSDTSSEESLKKENISDTNKPKGDISEIEMSDKDISDADKPKRDISEIEKFKDISNTDKPKRNILKIEISNKDISDVDKPKGDISEIEKSKDISDTNEPKGDISKVEISDREI